MNTPSLRKTRAAVGDIIGVVHNHAKALDGLNRAVDGYGKALQAVGTRGDETREMVDALLDRGFIGRLKWLVTGH